LVSSHQLRVALEWLAIFASLYTGWRKKAVKIAHLTVNMPANGGQIEVNSSVQGRNTHMGGTSKKPEKGKTTKDGGKKSPPKVVEDDDYEDGDIATPKRDRYGEDDQPL
jgi:hypothetical protein